MTFEFEWIAVLLAFASTWALPSAARAQALTDKEMQAVIAPFYKALNAGNDAIALINEATAPDWMSYSGNDACRPREQVGAAIAGLKKTVPDLRWEVKEIIVAGDRVIVRGEASGKPVGTFIGVQDGGKAFRVMSIDVHTIKDGKMIRSYHVEDWIGATRQLSAQ